ncbi:fructosamine 3 kinase [Cricetulus griseus]
METLLKRELGCSSVKATGHSGGGCISQGQSYDTDKGRVFVKVNSKAEARRMFEGEMASLMAIMKTDTVKVPKPIKVLDAPGGGSVLVMEHLDMRYLSSHAAKLGSQLADLHLENKKLGEGLLKEAGTVGKGSGQAERLFVDQFGFDVVTCCGYLPQVNDWQNDWVTFYARQRIQPQMDMVEKRSGDREALELWSALQLKIPDLFHDLEIVPSLLHGDLWGGNVAEDSSGPIIFDPASFYGHSEYELAIAGMFGGFSSSFYSAYHSPLLCVISRHSGPRVSMEQLLRAELRTKTLRAFGSSGAGCISEGRAYDTDTGPVFVKVNRRTQARQMFEGEMASLEALRSTGLVRVPKPMKVIDLPGGGAAFVMEYLKMKSLSSQASKLGDQMADLHLYNQKLREKSKARENTVVTILASSLAAQVNEWQDDWPTFFTQHRLQAQLNLIEKDYADRETQELWSRLQVKIPDLFSGIEIVPALLHGDLWSGNVAEDDQGPIIYDPASFYGHSEFELAIALMFGGFPRSFFTAYHQKIPKAPGFDKRLMLYQLFNYLNHWNHFGREYRSPSLGMMRKLLR